MPSPQGIAAWPGVQQFRSFSGTLAHGITPGVYQLAIAPQYGYPAAAGTLTLTFGGTVITLSDCRIQAAGYTRNASGEIVSLSIVDRRWKWAFGEISGQYNVLDKFGNLVQPIPGDGLAINDTVRTPQQLATLCLDAMGETNYDIGDIPNETRPAVNWDAKNPAKALQELCDYWNCRIVLRLDGTVAVRVANVGEPLPGGAVMPDTSDAIDLTVIPDEIRVLTAPIRCQADLLLEAVGAEPDGSIVPVDELSYTPAGGWNAADVLRGHCATVAAEYRELAKSCVWRMYRVKTPFKTPYTGDEIIPRVDRILPLESEQALTALGPDGHWLRKPAIVFGVWHDENSASYSNTATALAPLGDDEASDTILSGWRLDEQRGIVVVDRPVSRFTVLKYATTTIAPALLVLRCAFSLRSARVNQYLRYSRERKMFPGQKNKAESPTLPLILVKDDIETAIYCHYSANGYFTGEDPAVFTVTEKIDSLVSTNVKCDHYLDIAAKSFIDKTPQSATYAGIVAADPDGAIQAVTWSISESGATTRIDRNKDYGTPTTLSYAERRMLERQGEIEKARRAAEVAAARTTTR